MKKTLLLFVLPVMMIACNQSEKKSGDAVSAAIEEILASPGDFEGKAVVLTGMVTHVCKHGGQKCFVLAGDGESQIRVNAGPELDEFDVALEGSTVEFTGIFKTLTVAETTELQESNDSMVHHQNERAHKEAENAAYFLEASSYREITE
ncbi:MAG: hypothetical protein JXR52_00265 [Bacteroidales bacterium]|nr:hypothetical protein [Bacteroidales bacterium]MBN2697227.1 hypothetical protein [Bacteroidales bacterium]